ncbi:MAG: hypothetical protein HFG28_02070 [Eubacterium sp.]|nr:hypothetical protein [Eubacterium sp.]
MKEKQIISCIVIILLVIGIMDGNVNADDRPYGAIAIIPTTSNSMAVNISSDETCILVGTQDANTGIVYNDWYIYNMSGERIKKLDTSKSVRDPWLYTDKHKKSYIHYYTRENNWTDYYYATNGNRLSSVDTYIGGLPPIEDIVAYDGGSITNEGFNYYYENGDKKFFLGEGIFFIEISPKFFYIRPVNSDISKIVRYDGTVISDIVGMDTPFPMCNGEKVIAKTEEGYIMYDKNGIVKRFSDDVYIVEKAGEERVNINAFSEGHIDDLNGNDLTKNDKNILNIIEVSNNYFIAETPIGKVLYKWGAKDLINFGDKIQTKATTSVNTKNISVKTVKPSNSSIKKIISKKKALKITWKKVKGVNGYKIQYSLKKNFKGAKTKRINKPATTSLNIKKLKRKKKYYIRIRTYKIVNGKVFQSAWSKATSKNTK